MNSALNAPPPNSQMMPGFPMMPGVVPPPMGFPMASNPPPIPPSQPPPPNEPPPKKQKVDQGLIPADEWIASHVDPIAIHVVIPNYENKNGWDLKGQTLTFNFRVSEPVSALKDALSKSLNGMPSNKQNLKVEGLPFLKDKDSLANYNLDDNVEIQLSVKERGKRRK